MQIAKCDICGEREIESRHFTKLSDSIEVVKEMADFSYTAKTVIEIKQARSWKNDRPYLQRIVKMDICASCAIKALEQAINKINIGGN